MRIQPSSPRQISSLLERAEIVQRRTRHLKTKCFSWKQKGAGKTMSLLLNLLVQQRIPSPAALEERNLRIVCIYVLTPIGFGMYKYTYEIGEHYQSSEGRRMGTGYSEGQPHSIQTPD